MSGNIGAKITPSAGAKSLQERLNELLTRLAATIELVKNWPESEGDDASIHVETTTKLIASIKSILVSVEKVDGVIKDDADLRKNLQDCLIPLDLLDLLDQGGGLNPDCFSRALLKEALGQLAGLKRRKLALEMLGAAVRQGLNKREAQDKTVVPIKKEEEADTKQNAFESLKRKRSQEEAEVAVKIDQAGSDLEALGEPPSKKQSISSSPGR